jgi:hypothetical protein
LREIARMLMSGIFKLWQSLHKRPIRQGSSFLSAYGIMAAMKAEIMQH